MATPYLNDAFDDAGTANFPISEADCGDPDLAAAANALFFSSDDSAPVTSFGTDYPWPGDGGTAPLPLHLLDSPEAGMLANSLAGLGSAPGADDVEVPPYVNPANTNSPDAVYALNLLSDLL